MRHFVALATREVTCLRESNFYALLLDAVHFIASTFRLKDSTNVTSIAACKSAKVCKVRVSQQKSTEPKFITIQQLRANVYVRLTTSEFDVISLDVFDKCDTPYPTLKSDFLIGTRILIE